MEKDLFAQFDKGTLAHGGESITLASLPWKEHPEFRGVFLKPMVTAEQTGGLFSCFLVRIEPGSGIGRHVHPDSVELHEVVSGSGVCVTETGETPYGPGSMAVLARNAPHEVRAGHDGLRLLAKFITARA